MGLILVSSEYGRNPRCGEPDEMVWAASTMSATTELAVGSLPAPLP